MAAVRAVNATRQPEDSVALRAAVLGAVTVSVIAVAWEKAVSPLRAGVCIALLFVAYWVSYRRRAADNWHIKVFLACGAVVALLAFFSQLSEVATLDEIRFPLAGIFLWIQVLHSFDLPQRKDLNFSLGSSLALMGVAASLAQDLSLLPFLAVYFVFVVAALYLGSVSEAADATVAAAVPSAGGSRWAHRSHVARVAVAVLTAGVVLFLVTPQPAGVQRFSLPFSLGDGFGVVGDDALVNPGFEDGAPGARASGAAYHGFNEELDLRVRGDLNDRIVMRVRASAPAMLRGMIFDTYDGATWSAPAEPPRPLGAEAPYYYPSEFRDLGPRVAVSQTFYIEAEQPNAIFAGAYPEQVFFPSGVSIDSLGALRTGGTLSEGTVYSVVVSRGAARPEQLREVELEPAGEELGRYLQLPANLPARVRRLARRITAGENSVYDKVLAIEDYLRSRYRYSTSSPVPPEGRDAVDHFLFRADVGFCEQFASATTVMLRTLGIPARLVAGYTPGARNPLSGYYEVRNSDAHTWVEVHFPRYGWYEFDPTFAIPPAEPTSAEIVPLARALRAVAVQLRGLSIGAPEPSDAAALAALVAVALGVTALARRRRARRKAPGVAVAPAGAVEAAWLELEEALAERGEGRAPPETARELIARVGGPGSVSRTFERDRYADTPADLEEMRAAVGELRRLAEASRQEGGYRPRR
jgi:protein-glutamine gamma-glutamyltransferase